MSNFTIDEILGTEEFSTANGDFISYRVRFSGDQGNGEAQHNRKASSPAPVPGETIDAEIQHRNGRAQLKRIYKPQGGSSGGGSGWKPRDPRETRQIVHQHAQKVAVQYATVRAYQKTLPPEFTLEDIFKIAAQFRADVEAVE